jgi:hypothetical protein
MATILSDVPPGVLKVLSRSIGDPYGIAENAIEGAVSGALAGAIAHRLSGNEKATSKKKAIKEGAKLGALHGAVGKVVSRIPGEAIRERRSDSGSAFKRLLVSEDSPLGSFYKKDIGREVGSMHKSMAKGERVLRNIYTYNRMRTAIKEEMKKKKQVNKIEHSIKEIK